MPKFEGDCIDEVKLCYADNTTKTLDECKNQACYDCNQVRAYVR